MLLTTATSLLRPAPGFASFIFAHRRNQLLLAGAVVMAVMKMVVFKHFFPYMDFTSDTGSYMETTLKHMDYNIWPIGYSRFLWLFHQVSHSETVLAVLQFTLLEMSAFFFYFSVVYIFHPESYFRYGFYAFLLINPLFPFLGNYFISDALFLSLGLTWITLLLWILHKPTTTLLVLHGLVLGAAFTIRYNALFYPLVALIPILCSRYRPWQKITAILLPVVLITAFVLFVRQKSYEHAGIRLFSAFSGWQMMNNAMYMLQYVKMDSTGVPAELEPMHKLVYQYCTLLKQGKGRIDPSLGSAFMWDNGGPQKIMLARYNLAHPGKDTYTGWANVAPLFGSYGAYMIKKYPWDFLHYYIWPNAKQYLFPEMEVLAAYNRPYMGSNLQNVAAFFTDGAKEKPVGKYGDTQLTLMAIFPWLIVVCHVLFLEETIRYLIRKGIRRTSRKFNLALLLCWTFILLNFGFSVFAAPIVLRYQVLLIVLLLGYTLLLTEIIDMPERSPEEIAAEDELVMLGI